MKYYDLNPGQLADWIEAEKRGQSTLQENLSEQVKESVQYWLQTTESNKMRDPLQITGDDAAGTQALSDTVDANIADREDASTTNVQCTKAQELPKFLEPDVTADYTIFAETVMQDEATRLTI
ncbi:protein of unknown function [Taphrina deformans PYCC 5710]|uniref:Uncharacterized protein n=1 Tax=Taphrina deformans (strain PYCC 5710 / ATCC 11124 / CBS 356.35 / IMI 108563 / JCM 9778 / NBRC 8474) TaxID=1097556 RepID=R4XI31_TAPDE|nr:protein of unknown function [Taphrina deformans PYCC 5710]|eukprot:CCG83057.1 protein of unknown function [Taphrina deformans PYCC 5710]